MPTAKFQADFSDFLNKTREASGSLEKLADAAGSTSGSLSKVGSSFTGEALIRKAVDTATAIEKIGGASALTEREMVRVNATVTEAISKLGALGAKAPKELTDLASATQAAADKSKLLGSGIDVARLASDAFGTAMKSAMTTLLPLLTFTEFVRLGKEAVDFAGTISDMSAKTGIGVEALQQFKYAGEQVGVSLDTITGATAMLQKRIAGGDEGVARAIQKMGMSFNDFANLKPEDQLLRIAKHAESITNPIERTQFGVEALGKSFAEVSPLLVSGLEEMTQKATSLGIVMDKKTVAAIDNVGDSFSTLTSVGMALIGKVLAPFIPLLNLTLSALLKLGDGVMSVVTPAVEFLAKAWLGFLIKLAEGLKWISDAIPGFNRLTGASDALSTAIGSMQNALGQMSNGMQATQTETKKVATEFHVTSDAAKKHSDEIAKLADKYGANGLTKDALNLVEALKQVTDMSKLSSDQQAKLAKDVIELGNQYRALGKEVPAHIQALIDQSMRLVVIPEILKKGNEEARKELERITKAFIDNTSKMHDEASKKSLKTLDDAMTAAGKVMEEFDKVTLSSFELAVKHADKWRDDTLKAIEPLKTSFPALYAELGRQVEIVYKKMVDDAKQSATQQQNTFGSIMGNIPGVILKAIQGGGDIGKAIMSSIGKDLFDTDNGPIGKMLAGGVQKLASFVGKMSEGLGKNLFAGLTSSIPMIGQAIGPLIGWIGGKLSGLFGVSQAEKEGRAAADKFRQGLMSGLTDAQLAEVQKAAQGAWKGNEAGAATVIALRDAYKAVGRTAEEAAADAQRLSAATKRGAEAVAAVQADINKKLQEQKDLTKFLNDTFPAALKAVADSGGLVTAEFAGIISKLDEMGASSQAIAEFITGQVTSAMGGLKSFLDNGTIATQKAASAMTAAAVASFDELMKRGMSAAEALQVMAPVIDSLQRQLEQTGFKGGAAFAEIQALASLASDKIAGPMLKSVEDLNKVMTGLQNAGLLTQDMFSGLVDQITTTFNELIAKGFNGDQVMKMMQPTLQRIWELMQDFGYEVDDATQNLITQAQEAGLVGEAHRDASDVAVKAMQAAAEAMQHVAEILERVFGSTRDQAQSLADDITNAFDAIPREVSVTIRANREGFDNGVPPEGYASGTKGVTGRWFKNFGPGTPAMLHGDEAVVRRDQADEFAATFGTSDAGVLDELANIRSSLSSLPQHIARAVRDAILVAG